jgi:hypothetical protein
MRAAASSRASGRPSSWRQVAATSLALASVTANPGFTRAARWVKERDRGRFRHVVGGGRVRPGRSRAEQHLDLGADPERRLARRHDLEAGTAGGERGDVRGSARDLLEVVEHQAPLFGEQRRDRVHGGPAVRLGDVERRARWPASRPPRP